MFYAFLKLDLPTDLPSKQASLSPYVTVVDVSASMPQVKFDGAGSEMRPASRDVIQLRYYIPVVATTANSCLSCRCLKELLLDLDKSGKVWVNVEKLGQILNWFGPLTQRRESDTAFLDRVIAPVPSLQ